MPAKYIFRDGGLTSKKIFGQKSTGGTKVAIISLIRGTNVKRAPQGQVLVLRDLT